MKEDVLSGFSAVFEGMSDSGIDPEKLKDVEIPNPVNADEPVDLDIDDEPDMPIPNETDNSNDDGGPIEGDVDDDVSDDDVSDVDEVAVSLFDAVASAAGWGDIADEDKPKTVEELVEYLKSTVEENSVPSYSSEEIRDLDEFVRNGGTPMEFYQAVGAVDYDNIDISNETIQRQVVKELLVRQGYNNLQIQKKLDKYEDADILEDEAADAIEALKDIREKEKKALLEEQKVSRQQAIEQQQTFYRNVVKEIEDTVDIRGIKIPSQDKSALMKYIFEVESDGKTRYQKDYAKSTKNLIESAYFTMKGDSLISSARKSGETSAVEKLKNTLKTNKVGGSKQTLTNGPAKPLWSMASAHLLNK